LRAVRWILPVLPGLFLVNCSPAPKPAADTVKPPDPPRITQFYTTTPQVPKGEKGMLCYGVENAKAVWLSPPKRELSAAISRCVEVEPTGRTTYTLTAAAADGKTVTQDLVLGSGPARVRILNIDISAAEIPAGGIANICYKVENAKVVTITPVHFQSTSQKGCTIVQPAKTTAYVVTATGAGGDTDEEIVTIKVVPAR
jgi:hypothetical protein